MVLSFPDQSRRFDATRWGVRFWSCDSAIEISFFVEANALERLRPKLSAVKAGFLEAFDAERERIHEVVDNVYVRSHKGSYAHVPAAADI